MMFVVLEQFSLIGLVKPMKENTEMPYCLPPLRPNVC